jgi:hypothetical protein
MPMNLSAAVRHYRANFQKRAHDELESFRNEPTLEAAVRRAALAEDSEGKRYSHQHRLKRADLERAAAALAAKVEAIATQPSFARLIELVESTLHVERGLGELYIYDTALRIGAKLGHPPVRAYLHSGARDGALALGLDAKHRKALDKGELPPELRVMQMHEVEDTLCIYKRYFAEEVLELDDARACWIDDANERG